MARLTGTAERHAQWRELTETEHAAAVGELRELATTPAPGPVSRCWPDHPRVCGDDGSGLPGQ